jgi:hypothetical protein
MIKTTAAGLAAALVLAAGAVAPANAGPTGLLGLMPGFPQLDVNSAGGQGCSYDSGTQTLTITATASFYFPTASSLDFVTGGLVTLTAGIDNSGNLTGGTFVVNGTTTGGLTDPLLTGTVSDYGTENSSAVPNATDRADFRMTPTGGSIIGDPAWPAGADIGMTGTLELSTFNGSFNENWSCGRYKSIIGPIDATGDMCNLTLWKTAVPDELGPFGSSHDDDSDDSDSDSGNDHDWSGDTDDSDYHGGDSDSGNTNSHAGAACGCKSQVTQLTVRYNLPIAKIVQVKRKAGGNNWVSIFGPQLLQPGQEVTFAVSGKKIDFLIEGQSVEKLDTGCKSGIGAGQEIGGGDLVVVSGKSKHKNNKPLCPAPGTSCGVDHQVTYSYKVTNNGTAVDDVVIFDDQIGVVAPAFDIAGGGAMVTKTKTVCIFEDTINKATATGTQGANGCASNEAEETVVVLPSQCPPGSDTDSDSGADNNGNGDSDDSDADSGPADCDRDEPQSCFGGGYDSDSDSGQDHNHNGDSDDSDSDSGQGHGHHQGHGNPDCDLDDSG